jgi:hypothetical protein
MPELSYSTWEASKASIIADSEFNKDRLCMMKESVSGSGIIPLVPYMMAEVGFSRIALVRCSIASSSFPDK